MDIERILKQADDIEREMMRAVTHKSQSDMLRWMSKIRTAVVMLSNKVSFLEECGDAKIERDKAQELEEGNGGA